MAKLADRLDSMSKEQRWAIGTAMLMGAIYKFVVAYRADEGWNKELVDTATAASHIYKHFYYRRSNYDIVERDGKLVFDSRKDGAIQHVAVENGIACRQFYDAQKGATGCTPLP